MTNNKTENNKIVLESAITLEDARAMIEESHINQEEISVLSRLKARELGLHKAKKISRSNVSMFLYGKLRRGHVFTAIRYAIQDYLKVEIDLSGHGY